MLHPHFVIPQEENTGAAIAALGEELALFDDQEEAYHYIIAIGKKLPPFPPELCDEAHRILGCQSQVWLEAGYEEGKLYFAAFSDASIVRGLLAMLLRIYSGRSPAEILAVDPVFLKDLGVLGAVSTARGNGLASVLKRIHALAEIYKQG